AVDQPMQIQVARGLLRQRGDGNLADLVLLRRGLARRLVARSLGVPLRIEVRLMEPFELRQRAIALLADLLQLALLLERDAAVAPRFREERGGMVDLRLVLLEQLHERVALLPGELGELEADGAPAARAIVQVAVEIEALRPRLQVGETVAHAVDLLRRRPRGLELALVLRERLLQRLGAVRPAAEDGREAVRALGFRIPLVEPGGLAGGLRHQAVEMLHLESARRGRQMPSPPTAQATGPNQFTRRKGRLSRASS